CFQLLNELEHVGEVIASSPGQAEIEAEAVGSLFQAVVMLKRKGRGAVALEAVQQALALIDDVHTVQVQPYVSGQTGQGEASTEDGASTSGASTSVASTSGSTSARVAGVRGQAAEPAPNAQPKVEALQSSVRVDVEQLDALMNMVGEL